MFPGLTSLTGGGGLSAPSSASAETGDSEQAANLSVGGNAGITFGDGGDVAWLAVAAAVLVVLLWRR